MSLARLPALVLAAVAAFFALRSCHDGRAREAYAAENARLRTDAAQSRLHAAGYRTTLAHVTDNLRETLAERSDWRALAEEPDAEPVALVTATATAEARIETPVEPVQDTAHAVTGYRGTYADSTFALRWSLALGPPLRFAADVRAALPLELVGYRLPDGSLGVTAASRDRRVHVDVEDFVWQPPPAPQGCRWRCKLTWAAGGAALGALGWELAR